MSPEEFRKKYAKSGNKTLDILNEYYKYINPDASDDFVLEVTSTIEKIQECFLNDPENYHFDANIYLGIEKLTKLLP